MAVETLTVHLLAKTEKFTSAMAGVQKQLATFGRKAQALGSTITANVSAPIAGFATATVMAGSKFESAMTRIKTLVGITGKEFDDLRAKVLEIAPDLGKTPVELAQALEKITSAGFRGNQAIEMLTLAAKAGVIGLGDVKTVADAVGAALNAYRNSNLTAAEATNIMVGAARAGNMETSEFAGALKGVIDQGANANVSLADLAGALAAASLTTKNVTIASTELSALLTAVVNPASAQAVGFYRAMGLEADAVANALKKGKGLNESLAMMARKAQESGTAYKSLLGSTEAAKLMMTLFGDNAKRNSEIMGELNQKVDYVDQAFGDASSTVEFKMNKALSSTQRSMIKLSDDIMPRVASALDVLARAVKAMGDLWEMLPEPIQDIILLFGTLAAVIGPVVFVVGKLVSGVAMLMTYLPTVVTVLTEIGLGISLLFPQLTLMRVTMALVAAVFVAKWDWIKTSVGAAADWIITKVKETIAWLEAMWAKLKKLGLSGAVSAVMSKVSSLWGGGAAAATGDANLTVARANVEGLRRAGLPVPQLATGGRILQDGLANLHAGEMVVPAKVASGSSGKGMNQTIVMNVDGRQLLRFVAEGMPELLQIKTGFRR